MLLIKRVDEYDLLPSNLVNHIVQDKGKSLIIKFIDFEMRPNIGYVVSQSEPHFEREEGEEVAETLHIDGDVIDHLGVLDDLVLEDLSSRAEVLVAHQEYRVDTVGLLDGKFDAYLVGDIDFAPLRVTESRSITYGELSALLIGKADGNSSNKASD